MPITSISSAFRPTHVLPVQEFAACGGQLRATTVTDLQSKAGGWPVTRQQHVRVRVACAWCLLHACGGVTLPHHLRMQSNFTAETCSVLYPTEPHPLAPPVCPMLAYLWPTIISQRVHALPSLQNAGPCPAGARARPTGNRAAGSARGGKYPAALNHVHAPAACSAAQLSPVELKDKLATA